MRLTEVQIARIKFLENERGQITADLLLADARQADSPLNSLFDWDQTKAAEAWWLECAREVIRTVKIIVTTNTTTVTAPYYVRDPDVIGQGYRNVVALQRDTVAARQSLINELVRAAGNLTRARHLAIVLGLTDDVDHLMGEIVAVQRRVGGDDNPDDVGLTQ